MLRCSCWVRICILANLSVSSYCGVLSRPFFLASVDIAMNFGNTLASCFFNCGVTFGATPLASFSNSALVTTVLQSAEEALGAVALAGAAAAPLAAAGFGVAAHTPSIVMTAASAGTEADLSAGAAGA